MSRCGFVFIYSAQYPVWFFHLKTLPWIVEVSLRDEFMAASTKAHWALLNKLFPCYFVSSWISLSLDSANIQATPMLGTGPGALISQHFLFTLALRQVASSISTPTVGGRTFSAWTRILWFPSPCPRCLTTSTFAPRAGVRVGGEGL